MEIFASGAAGDDSAAEPTGDRRYRPVDEALKLLERRAPAPPADGIGDLDDAREHVRELAAARRS